MLLAEAAAACPVICRVDSALAPDSVSGGLGSAGHFSQPPDCAPIPRLLKDVNLESVLAALLNVRKRCRQEYWGEQS